MENIPKPQCSVCESEATTWCNYCYEWLCNACSHDCPEKQVSQLNSKKLCPLCHESIIHAH